MADKKESKNTNTRKNDLTDSSITERLLYSYYIDGVTDDNALAGTYENAYTLGMYNFNTPTGYENIYNVDGTDNEDVHFVDTSKDAKYLDDSEGVTNTGKLMTSHLATLISGSNFKNLMFGYDRKIIGLPYKYSHLADPMARVFQSTFETDNSCVCFVRFGVAKINRMLFNKMTLDANFFGGSSVGDVSKAGYNILEKAVFGLWGGGGNQDRRIISFDPDHTTFMKYASTSLSQLYMEMDLPGMFTADNNDWKEFDDLGFPFYCIKSGSFNETLNNQYDQPEIIEQMNSNAKRMRENYQLYGTYGTIFGGVNKGGLFSIAENLAAGWLEGIEQNLASNEGIIGAFASTFMSTNKGSMSYYGKIWSDSQSSRSLELNFKFRSPYGNKFDIFRNVFFPFLLWHTAAIPKQDGRFSYKEPFLVQVEFPGWFNVNCGCIEQITWTKGGDQNLMTSDGLPLEMDVTVTLCDLYPIELASEGVETLAYNYGLHSFLSNLSGIRLDQVKTLYNQQGMTTYLQNLIPNSDNGEGGSYASISSGILRYRNYAFISFADDDYNAIRSNEVLNVNNVKKATAITNEEKELLRKKLNSGNLTSEERKRITDILYHNNDFNSISDLESLDGLLEQGETLADLTGRVRDTMGAKAMTETTLFKTYGTNNSDLVAKLTPGYSDSWDEYFKDIANTNPDFFNTDQFSHLVRDEHQMFLGESDGSIQNFMNETYIRHV